MDLFCQSAVGTFENPTSAVLVAPKSFISVAGNAARSLHSPNRLFSHGVFDHADDGHYDTATDTA